jgi:hypothetical protein
MTCLEGRIIAHLIATSKSRSDNPKVAVAFKPRTMPQTTIFVAERRVIIWSRDQASLRDAELPGFVRRGVNPTATIIASLREDRNYELLCLPQHSRR